MLAGVEQFAHCFIVVCSQSALQIKEDSSANTCSGTDLVNSELRLCFEEGNRFFPRRLSRLVKLLYFLAQLRLSTHRWRHRDWLRTTLR